MFFRQIELFCFVHRGRARAFYLYPEFSAFYSSRRITLGRADAKYFSEIRSNVNYNSLSRVPKKFLQDWLAITPVVSLFVDKARLRDYLAQYN